MKRLGPELKTPELKAPQFLSDLYWDLRDRRLLPLLAFVVVAIVAVPFLLGKGGNTVSVSRRPAAVAAGGASGSRTTRLVAVKAEPGLRDYHKRLAHRSPTDPFKQRFNKPDLTGTKLGGGETSSTTTTTTKSSNGKTTTTTKTDTTNGSGGGGTTHGELRYYTVSADIKIVRSEVKSSGKVVHGKPTVHHRVLPPASVPGEKQEAVVYLGVDKNRKPLLLVSDAVKGVFGDGKCLSGSTVCQLLEVEKGMPETFVYGEEGKVRFKITILKTKLVDIGKVNSSGE